MKSRIFGAVCAYVLALGASVEAEATIVGFNSEGDFLSSASIASTETFDEYTGHTDFVGNTVVIDSVHYFAEDDPDPETGGRNIWTVTSAASGTNFLVSNFITDNVFSFGADRHVEAFGFNFSNGLAVPVNTWEIRVTETDGNTESYFFNNNDIVDSNVYFGFLSDVGISQVLIHDDPSDIRSNWRLDNVSRSAIVYSTPIPPALYLFGSGLIGLIGIARKRTV